MYIGRKPVLTPEKERALEKDLAPLWLSGLPAETIANRLNFGELKPYEDLKTYHIYYYRRKFGLPPRTRRLSGIKRYRVHPEDIKSPPTIKNLIKDLDKVYNPNSPIRSIGRKARMIRAYILTHFYSPLRKSEIYERQIKDFEIIQSDIAGDYIKISLKRKKKIKEAKVAPFYISLDFPHVNEIVEWLDERTKETDNDDDLVFPLSSWQAWNAVKKVFPEGYPHYWRFEYITEMADDPTIPIEHILADTDLHIVTVRIYMMSGERQRRLSLMSRRKRPPTRYKK